MEINTPQPNPDSTNAVVLKHTLPDGSSHYDWMIEFPDLSAERRLLTFRTDIRPDQTKHGEPFPAQLIDTHRVAYLSFEGEIGDGRGSVVRESKGICDSFRYQELDSGRFVIHWGLPDSGNSDQETVEYCGKWHSGDQWIFHGYRKCSHDEPASDIMAL